MGGTVLWERSCLGQAHFYSQTLNFFDRRMLRLSLHLSDSVSLHPFHHHIVNFYHKASFFKSLDFSNEQVIVWLTLGKTRALKPLAKFAVTSVRPGFDLLWEFNKINIVDMGAQFFVTYAPDLSQSWIKYQTWKCGLKVVSHFPDTVCCGGHMHIHGFKLLLVTLATVSSLSFLSSAPWAVQRDVWVISFRWLYRQCHLKRWA